MCKLQMLSALVKQRLTAAAEEIFWLIEGTIAEYEEELCRSKAVNERQQKLLDAVFNPQLRLHREDVQQLLVVKEEVPLEQQELSSSLDQEDPAHIKEEQKEVFISQEGGQLQGLEEADVMKFTFTPVLMKSEDDEEKPQSSQLHPRQSEHMETEADGEDWGGPEPDGNSDPDIGIQPDTEDKTAYSSESETEHSDDVWNETKEPQSGLKSLKNVEVPVSDSRCSTGEKPFHCSECEKGFDRRADLSSHMRIHTGERPFPCSVCGKGFISSASLRCHMRIHSGEKPFSCSFCNKSFKQKCRLQSHMRTHTGERPFPCSVCGKGFISSASLRCHMRIHSGEKPFRCSVCGKGFVESGNLKSHMRTHTGEKPFSCSVCGKCFIFAGHRKIHMRIHTGEKPFSCSVCDKSFKTCGHLKSHMRIHTGEKPYSCSVCGRRFIENGHLKSHMRIHTGEKPYSCSVCNHSFSIKQNLKSHMLVHTGEKPFSCSVCNKRFALRPKVTQHKCLGHQPSQLHHTQTEENREVEPPVSI